MGLMAKRGCALTEKNYVCVKEREREREEEKLGCAICIRSSFHEGFAAALYAEHYD